ncbi:GNAT family N-acetyltransferase [Flindersiella endophytica]
MQTVRRAEPADIPACVGIVRALPDYFTDDVPAKVEADLRTHAAWVAVRDDTVIGFAVVERRSRQAAEILWLAVAPDAHRTGVATGVVDRALGELANDGLRVVEVKTLDGSAGYAPYDATRAFWEHSGFVQVDTIDPLPGWQPGNPAAIYVAALAPTRAGVS